jgi:polar amino acid transport system substrate-binding protein
MNKILLALYLIGTCISSNCIAEETIRISTGEFPPYLSENLAHNGVGLRIIKEAFALEGVKVEYGFFPWKRSYKLAKTGEWDASATWGHNADRDKHFYFSDPLYPARSVFFHLKSYQFDWNTLEDLKGISIGATQTYAYTPEFLEAIDKQTLNIELIASDEINFKKLLKGRTNIFPLNIDVAYALLANKFTLHERESITYHPRELYSIQSHLIFSKKNERNIRMLALFNSGLKRLRVSGKFGEYFEGIQRGEYVKKSNY